MNQHFLAYLICVPLIVALGVYNTRRKLFTVGEIRFWGICIFVSAELVFLGAFN